MVRITVIYIAAVGGRSGTKYFGREKQKSRGVHEGQAHEYYAPCASHNFPDDFSSIGTVVQLWANKHEIRIFPYVLCYGMGSP